MTLRSVVCFRIRRRCGRISCDHRAKSVGLAEPAGETDPATWRRQRFRYRRAVIGGSAQQTLGTAGDRREPARRRRGRRHQRLRHRPRRSSAAVFAVVIVHRASVSARQPALQAERPAADHARIEHHHRHFGAGELAYRHVQTTRGAGARRARQAQLGGRDRRARFHVRGLAQARGLEHHQGAVPQPGRCGERPRRGTRAGLRVGVRHRAATV